MLSRGALLLNLKDNDWWHSGAKQVLYSVTKPTRFSILCKDDSFTLLIMDTLATQKKKLFNMHSIIDVKHFSSYLKLLVF